MEATISSAITIISDSLLRGKELSLDNKVPVGGFYSKNTYTDPRLYRKPDRPPSDIPNGDYNRRALSASTYFSGRYTCKAILMPYLRSQHQGCYQVFPVEKRGISFVGFVFYHDKILLRKNIYRNIIKLCCRYRSNKITKAQFKRSMASYYGWLRCCMAKGICRIIYRLTGIYYSNWNGKRIKITTLYDESIKIYHIDKRKKYSLIQAMYHYHPIEVYTKNRKLIKHIFRTKRNTYLPNIKIKFYL